MRWAARHLFVIKIDAATRWSRQTRDDIEKRGLASTVGPNQSSYRPPWNGKRYIIKGEKTPKPFAKLMNTDQKFLFLFEQAALFITACNNISDQR